MPQVDVSHLGIRVILDQRFYGTPVRKGPLDVEGTVLSVSSRHPTAARLLNEGLILELVLSPNYRGMADVYVRWDTDEKEWFSCGNFLFRRAKVGFCVNIWDSNEPIEIDCRPYHELKSQYYRAPESAYFGGTTWSASIDENTVYKSLYKIPQDGYWHMCEHEGVLSHARSRPHGFEVKEDSPDAPVSLVIVAAKIAPMPSPEERGRRIRGLNSTMDQAVRSFTVQPSLRSGSKKKKKKKKTSLLKHQYNSIPPQGMPLREPMSTRSIGNPYTNHGKGSYTNYANYARQNNNDVSIDLSTPVYPTGYKWGSGEIQPIEPKLSVRRVENVQTFGEFMQEVEDVKSNIDSEDFDGSV